MLERYSGLPGAAPKQQKPFGLHPAEPKIADFIQELEWVSAISQGLHNALIDSGAAPTWRPAGPSARYRKIAPGNYSSEKGIGEAENGLLLAVRVEIGPEQQFQTVRDWLRYAVSRFRAADLSYGHGTTNAVDEAAYLILHTLHLPIDQLEPWLDAQLLPSERQALAQVIATRVSTRKPASYLTNEAWIQGHSFYVDERVIVPRSYIGELLAGHLAEVVQDPTAVTRVLDICTGSGCLAILAAIAFTNASIDASDISAAALEVAHRNVQEYGLEDRIGLMQSDLFAALSGRRYDLILANPPYVREDAIAAFPPEHAAEPRLAHAGGLDGLEFVRRILAAAADHLSAAGILVVEVGSGRALLEQQFPRLPFLWLDTANSEGEVFALTQGELARAGVT